MTGKNLHLHTLTMGALLALTGCITPAVSKPIGTGKDADAVVTVLNTPSALALADFLDASRIIKGYGRNGSGQRLSASLVTGVAQQTTHDGQIALSSGWIFFRGSNSCVIEGPNSSQGTKVSISRFSDDDGAEYIVMLTNSSWSSVPGRKISITAQYWVAPVPLGPSGVVAPMPVQMEATGLEGLNGGTTAYGLLFAASQQRLDALFARVSRHMRIGFSRDGIMLTDWMFIPQDARDHINGCSDPFKS